MVPSRIESLANTIAELVQELRDLLAQNGLEEPSFSAECPSSTALLPAADEAGNVLLRAAFEIQDLLLDPVDLLRSYASVARPLGVTAFYPALQHRPAGPTGGATTTFAAIAAQCGLPEADVRCLLRHAMTIRVFGGPREGEVIHTRVSMLPREDGIHGEIGSTCQNGWPSATRAVESLKRFSESSDPTQSPVANAREEDEAAWRALLHSTDPRFTWIGARKPTGSALAIVEGLPGGGIQTNTET